MRDRGKTRSRKQPVRALLKFRVIPLARMPKSVLFAKIRQACREGVVPDDIELQTLDWGHARGGRFLPGAELNAEDAEELKNCYAVLTAVGKDHIRFERA